MRCKFFSLLLLMMLSSCSSSSKKKEDLPKAEVEIKKIERDQISVYALKVNPKIDTLLLSMDQFLQFKNTMEDLSKLNPLAIEPFLLEALLNCEKLLRQNFPSPFNTPDIKSRLKVVKTALLKARYYSQEKREKELNTNLIELYQAYAAFLQRIEDFSTEDLSTVDVVNQKGNEKKPLEFKLE